MLHAIALQNFKAYEELKELELRPLTVFCGSNAVGKSSVIQSLLMMQQTISGQPSGHSVPLVTDGEDVSLGDYADLLFGHDLERCLRIELTVPLTWGERGFWEEPVNLTLQFSYSTENTPYFVDRGEWERFFRFRDAMPDLGRLRLIAKGNDGRDLVTVKMGQHDYDEYYNLMGLEVDLTFGEQMKHADRHFKGPVAGIERIEDWFDETKRDGVTLTEWDDDCGAEELVGLVSRMLYEASRRLTIRYVGPAREAPQRYYDVDKRSVRTGSRRHGQSNWKTDVAQFGERSSVRKPLEEPRRLSEHEVSRLRTPLRSIPYIPASIALDEAVNSWLSYLGLPEVHPVREGRDFRFAVPSPYANQCSVSVTDTGYGVSQVLPILLACLAGSEEVVVLDQPELHLHPRVQTGIADFAMAAAERRQVLVETHSGHFVNRIVRRVVEGKVNSEDVAVYFFTPTADGPHVEMVEIDPTFGIKNWPRDFFDDYANEQEAIIRASLERRAKGDST
jgi:hypothetical protein